MTTTTNTTSITTISNQLSGVGWKHFIIDSENYYIKSKFSNDSYSIILTDLVLVWYKYSSIDNIIKDKSRFNNHLDTKIEKVLDILNEKLIDQRSDTTYSIEINSHSYEASLNISSKLSFYTFKWSFECEPMEKETILNVESRRLHSLYIKSNFINPLLYLSQHQQSEIKSLQHQQQQHQQQLQQQQQQQNTNTNNNKLNTNHTVGDKRSRQYNSTSSLNYRTQTTSTLNINNNNNINNNSSNVDINIDFKNQPKFDLCQDSTIQFFTKYHNYLTNLNNSNNNNNQHQQHDISDDPYMLNSSLSGIHNTNMVGGGGSGYFYDSSQTSGLNSQHSSSLSSLDFDGSQSSLQLYYEETPKKKYNNVKLKDRHGNHNSNNNSNINLQSTLTTLANYNSLDSSSLDINNNGSFNNNLTSSFDATTTSSSFSNNNNSSTIGGGNNSNSKRVVLNLSTSSSNIQQPNNPPPDDASNEQDELRRRLEIQEKLESAKNKKQKKKIKLI
ncbi:hypothetical protein DFA_02806 [Cavenderia fasciculata]|uniref:Non-homologous end-joining factor 1 n=1 Tax=Cavenderia fasciculata TaxID=261658 RepID=F4PIC9_CACFS|nr:uncharacterized protein DFA_02806 [Cavenderia fasciculata]EGG24563.1 hypothetical protein DFA_02806 [Cavenderia fasciculata]|eukprot:XP_004362414.1 hypothetical protein DFA_02806 [Cavenderia fasciculata]